MSKSTDFFSSITNSEYSNILAVEFAVLQHDIELPTLPSEPLTLATLEAYSESGKVYHLAERAYTNMIGNFYVPALFPLVEDGESTELVYSAPRTGHVIGDNFKTNKYVERNFVSLMIPKYIVMNFRDKIPSGTKFLVGFVGGSSKIININIIGIYGQNLDVEETEYDIYGGN